jgi:HK97 family phage prohead protease
MSGVSKGTANTGVEKRDASTLFNYDGDGARPVIRGNPIVFNSWSQTLRGGMFGEILFREVIAPEAVDRTLRSAEEIHAYWNHDGGEVLGSTASGTLNLRKTSSALAMELYPTQEWLATHHAAGLKRGDVRRMSFGFGVLEEKWSEEPDEHGVYEREIVDMLFSEVSIVGKPAYRDTTVALSQRSLDVFNSDVRRCLSLDMARKRHRNLLAR